MEAGKWGWRWEITSLCDSFSFFFLGVVAAWTGLRVGGHPYIAHPTTLTRLCSSALPPSALASLHVLGSGPWEWMAPGLCSVFEASQECEASFFLLSPSVVQAAGSASSYLQQWNIPSAALIVHRRAGRHWLTNQWLPLGSLGSRWGERGPTRSLPSNIWLSWLLGLVPL